MNNLIDDFGLSNDFENDILEENKEDDFIFNH